MPDLPTVLDLTNQRLAALSGWIDDHNAHRDAEARTWGRLAKLSEETGEAVAAYIGVTGQNPRKAILGHVGAVTDELYDVAITALGAVMHLHRNRPDADVIGTLLARIYDVCERAGLPEIQGRVAAKRGMRVLVDGRPGLIVSFPDQYIGVRFDGERHTTPCHPTWRVVYLAGRLGQGAKPSGTSLR